MKKVISVILIAIVVISCLGIMGSAADSKKSYYVACKTAADVLDFTLEGGKHAVPIRVVKAGLKKDGIVCWAYLVTLVGVESGTKQNNNIENCLKAGFGKTGEYFAEAKQIILDKVPKGSNLMLAGHSLGGMTVQQLSADPDIKANYKVLNTLTAGSPYIPVKAEREGTLHRLADRGDAIPWLSVGLITDTHKMLKEVSWEDGGFIGDPDSAHNISYRSNDVWGAYDAFGEKGGNAVITFNHALVGIYGEAK
ncbi:MAG: hypothetical protein IKS04_01850 [Clostridia bacterium]|nr:hypothetical protein [Clostridia bacterium]